MSRIALYREWRPRTFDQVVEQHHTVAALRQSVVTGNISHAYLFSGTRGTGKTTLAQIYSRAINCLNPQDGNPCNECAVCTGILSGTLLDVVEVDAASNNSVDNIRRICDEVVFSPSLAKYKVYIIDEVHMLSAGAFNALLKTLEEPPAHAVFILATTDPHRIPATILSRCQRYDFHRIPVAGIRGRLREIADADGISISDEALEATAAIADGALRDAISLLDQCRSTFTGTISRDDVLSLSGLVNDAFMFNMAVAIAAQDTARILALTDEMILDGRDVVRFTSDLAAYYRNVMVCRVSQNPETLIRATEEAIAGMNELAGIYPLPSLLGIIRSLSSLLSELRWVPDARTLFEISLIRIMQEHGPSEGTTLPERTPPVAASPPMTPTVPKKEPAPIAVVPNPEPEPVPEPEPDPEPVPDPEPEPEPELKTKQNTTMPSSAETAASPPWWSHVLDDLYRRGQMLLYLYLKPARVTARNSEVCIVFHPDEKANHAEVSRIDNLNLIRACLEKAAGEPLDVRVEFETGKSGRAKTDRARSEGPSWKQADWVQKIRASAEPFGIPIQFDEG